MSKTLIIAEKPSVATDLARVLGKTDLGKFTKKKDFFENDNAFVASAVGHLVELKMPEGENGKKLPWGIKHLPIIPKEFVLQPIERSLPKFKLLLRLLKKKEVTTVVNACDAGREGELIFRYLMKMADVKKDFQIKRMWMQSMTDDAIITAWNSMRSGEEMNDLADAAVCRSESDWLVGLNGTRALTAYNSRNGGFNMTTTGRVQTPTLVILAEREKIIRSFVPKAYWEVHADFKVSKGEYASRWINEEFKKDEDNEHARAERLWTKEEAEAIVARCAGKPGIVSEVKKPSKQAPPQLFDLTSLQREGSSKHGYAARRTLQLAQALYDRHKLLTYPRTDSKYLPEDYIDTIKKNMKSLAKGTGLLENLPACAKWIVDNDRVTPTKRVFNSKKVTDHFAIIPTGKLPPAKLDEDCKKLYMLVLRRFLGIFYPHAEYELTQRITRIGDDAFKTDGRVLVVPGYLEVYGRKAGVAGDKDELTGADDGESAENVKCESLEKETRPPARYNDSTLLSAMETAGKRVDDEELREAMSERGLGTPATRAAIIENLIRQKYMFRDDPPNRRNFVVSNKGLALVDLLQEIGLEALGSPEMTGEWEHKLKEMEAGRLSRDVFMKEVFAMTKTIVNQTREFTDKKVNRSFPDIVAECPECLLRQEEITQLPEALKEVKAELKIKKAELKEKGEKKGYKTIKKAVDALKKTVKEMNDKQKKGAPWLEEWLDSKKVLKQTDGTFECYDPECSFRIKKHIASHEITAAEATDLIKTRKIGPIDSFKSRFGKPFTAELTLGKKKRSWKLEFIFEGDDLREEELKNLTEEQVICECKASDDSDEMVKVYETDSAFLCPGMATSVDPRGVRISKTILKLELPRAQMVKYFVEGKTDLLHNFISSKKGRRFSAHLVLDRKNGKLGFEFAPKKKKKKKGEGDEKKGDDETKTEKDDVEKTEKTATKKKATKKKTAKKKATKKKSKKATKKKADAEENSEMADAPIIAETTDAETTGAESTNDESAVEVANDE